MDESDKNKNQLFNNIIDKLFSENITYIQLYQLLKKEEKEELFEFFLLILSEFGTNPDDIKDIFNNTNPKNKNLNMIFKDNAINIINKSHFNRSNFMDIFNSYINYSLNLSTNDLSYLNICYKTCKKLITNSYVVQKTEKNIYHIRQSIQELCFNCPNKFPFVQMDNPNYNYEIKRKFILTESFLLFKHYIKSKNQIHLYYLNKNNVMDILNKYRNNSYIKLLILYFFFEQRNDQYYLININKQLKFNYDVYKENIFSNFNLMELYYEFFIKEKNINFELENAIVVLMTQITKHFPEYNLFNNDLINNIIKYKGKIEFENFFSKEFLVDNIKLFDEIFFFKNPYKASIIFLNIIMNQEKKEMNIDMNNCNNYYELDKLLKYFNNFIENEIKDDMNLNEKKCYLMNIFIKTCMVIFIFFSNDLIIFAPILEPDNFKFYKNLYKFFFKLINILFLLIKRYHKYITKESKEKLLSLIKDISMSNPNIYIFILQTYSLFNSELVHFLVENIPHAYTAFNQLSFLYKYDKQIEHELYLNGLIMFGYLVNKYPLKEKFNNGLDILNCLQKVINLRELLKGEKNVDKFVLGIYLFYKAYPIKKNEMKGFINFLSKEIENSYEKSTKEKIGNLCNFIKKEFFVNDCYSNKNTNFVDINDFLKDNFNA